MGKSTISMAIFQFAMFVYQRVKSWKIPPPLLILRGVPSGSICLMSHGQHPKPELIPSTDFYPQYEIFPTIWVPIEIQSYINPEFCLVVFANGRGLSDNWYARVNLWLLWPVWHPALPHLKMYKIQLASLKSYKWHTMSILELGSLFYGYSKPQFGALQVKQVLYIHTVHSSSI